jgi:hypothetical protein
MKNTLITVSLAIAISAIAFAVRTAPTRSCETEEIEKTVSPQRDMTAVYENAICSTAPDVVEARINIVPGHSSSGQMSYTVFTAHKPVDKNLQRPTNFHAVSLKWVDQSTLSIQVAPELSGGIESHFKDLPIRLIVVRGAPVAGAKATSSKDSEVDAVVAALSSSSDRSVEQTLGSLYEKMGDERYWLLVNALWLRANAAYPGLNWHALDSIVNRLRVAGLWGQWIREFHKDPKSAQAAAEYARRYVGAEEADVRLEAISALGSVGSSDDLRLLAGIAKGDEHASALRATTAIYAIERTTPVSQSILPNIQATAQFDDVKATAARLNSLPKNK